MIVTAPRSALLRLLQTAAAPIDPGAAQPILTKLLLRANASQIQATGTDLAVTITARLPLIGPTPGAVCVGREIVDRVASMPEGEVTLKLTEGHLHVTAGSRKFKVETLPAESYPSVVEPPVIDHLDLDGKTIAAVVARGTHGMAEKESVVLQAGELSVTAGHLTAYSTDGRRLVVASAAVALPDMRALVVPSRGMKLLTKFMATAGKIGIAHDMRAIHVASADGTITCALADAALPDRVSFLRYVDDLRPGPIVTIDRKAMIDAIKAVGGADQNGDVDVALRGSKIVLTARDESAEDVLNVTGEGKASYHVQSRYLIAALDATEAVEVSVAFPASTTNPLVLRAGDSYLCVVMGLRPKGEAP